MALVKTHDRSAECTVGRGRAEAELGPSNRAVAELFGLSAGDLRGLGAEPARKFGGPRFT
jgi:hypothetical protein